MELLDSIPYLVRILLSLCAILVFQKLTKRLYLAMFCGILLLGVFLGHSASSMADVAFARLATADTVFLAAAITGIIWLSGLLSAAGVLRDLVASLKPRLGRRALIAVLPAVVGLLPMPGGALFSCPLIDDADGEKVLSQEMKTKINYWFRHVWEFWWPLYPGVLLAVAVSRMPVWGLALLLFPLYLAAIAFGCVFLLRQVPREKAAGAPARAEDGERAPFLPLLFPILTIVVVYAAILAFFPAVGRLSNYLPMLLGVVAAFAVLQMQRPQSRAAWRKVLCAPNWIALVVVVIMTRVYGAFIEGELPGGGLLMDGVRAELGAYGIPAVLLIALVPFVSGLTTGITIGYIGASFPVILPLAAEGMTGYFSTIVLGYGCGFLGMMLSPIHVCLIVTNQYYKTSLAGSLAGMLKPAAGLFCVVAAYAFLWWSLG